MQAQFDGFSKMFQNMDFGRQFGQQEFMANAMAPPPMSDEVKITQISSILGIKIIIILARPAYGDRWPTYGFFA